MPVSINDTTLTFNDATTQTTSGVTSVSAGTGISVAGGKTPTVTNTGVTSVTAGTGISVSASTGGVTITNTSSASGTVTSVATGNGLSGGTITSTGTLVIAAPAYNSIGSYAWGFYYSGSGVTINPNSNVTGGSFGAEGRFSVFNGALSGTWRAMSWANTGDGGYASLMCVRIS